MLFMQKVWSAGDLDAVDNLVGDEYVIHSDPGDPWEGQTLSREIYKERLLISRAIDRLAVVQQLGLGR